LKQVNNRNFEVHSLIEPNANNIRYIGYTSYGKRRLNYHIQACKSSREKHCHRCNWINKLLAKNLKPVYKVLCVVSDEIKAKKLEIELIKHYKQFQNLTNNTTGGDGTKGLKWSNESKKKQSLRLLGKPRQDLRKKVRLINLISNEILDFKDAEGAATYLKCTSEGIKQVCRKERLQIYKHTAAYI